MGYQTDASDTMREWTLKLCDKKNSSSLKLVFWVRHLDTEMRKVAKTVAECFLSMCHMPSFKTTARAPNKSPKNETKISEVRKMERENKKKVSS